MARKESFIGINKARINIKSIFTIILIAGFLNGCAHRRGDYNLGVKYIGHGSIEGVVVSFDNYKRDHGTVTSGADATEVSVGESHPIPDTVTMEWRTNDGRNHRKDVKLKNQVPEQFKELWILLNIDENGNVTVSYKELQS